MNIRYNVSCLLLILLIATTVVSTQASPIPQIVSSGFGENLSTGCPRLQVIDNMLYAPGPDGIKRHVKGENSSWEPFAMQGENVIDFRISNDDIIAVIIPEEYSQNTDMDLRSVARLVKGKISDTSFVDITPAEMEYEYRGHILTYLSAIAQHPTDKNCIMIMGHGGIFQSKDFGETWETISYYNATYNPHSFLGWHPQNPEILFMTSESMIYVGMVCRSIDGGKTWEIFEPDPNNESSCHDIAFDPDDADHLLLSGEYSIYESFDCGATWTKALDDINKPSILGYAYNIIYDPEDSTNSTVYSIGHENGGPNRNVIRSTDKGKTWQQCMSYDYSNNNNFFFDATLFDDKIWIYDFNDIIYWEINGNSGIDKPIINDLRQTEYYDLNGHRYNSLPESGIIIEKHSETSKKIVL